jgi:5-methyltetrahydrofolate--homocysteine methyltransferase
MPQPDSTHELTHALADRILVLDGAMGTTIRSYGLSEADARGKRFADSPKDLLNNGDILSITRPDVIGDIHKRFYEAGSDICETNTFSATSIAQSEFFVDDPREHGGRKDPEFFQKIIENPFLNELAWEMNVESARSAANGRTPSAATPAASATSPARSARSRFRSPTRPTPTTTHSGW